MPNKNISGHSVLSALVFAAVFAVSVLPLFLGAKAGATKLPLACTSFTQGFDDISALSALGWTITNRSEPAGTETWFQGNDAVTFSSHTGSPNSYIAVNSNSGADTATLSNWLLTPEITLQNGDTLTFYSRTLNLDFPDRLQVRMSTSGASTDVGTGATGVGDFGALILDINPNLTPDGYPDVWTQFTVTITGVPAPTRGRLAFRYFVTDGGPLGINSNYIGVDTLSYSCSSTPTPTPTPAPTIVEISGRVITPSGLSIASASVSLTDSSGVRRMATTSSFGIYRFENVPARDAYVIGVSTKRYRFASRVLQVSGNLANIDFVGLE